MNKILILPRICLIFGLVPLSCGGGTNSEDESSSSFFKSSSSTKKSSSSSGRVVQFVFTADPHYGLKRVFRNEKKVSSHLVNLAMIEKMNTLSATVFPNDEGVKEGDTVGSMDFLVMGGDIGNRSQKVDGDWVQSAADSWAQFASDYLDGCTLRNSAGELAPWMLMSGNHDISNAIGFYDSLVPDTDPTIMVELYNRH
ncbi:MAG TPA: hypothetical protein VLM37_12325, partial [Fibrobacteraceae bacterium]|nr:hypothetical protein [Fibrobacteraceae bacterium]